MESTSLKDEIYNRQAPAVHKVIITAEKVAGKGVEGDPMRRVLQVFSLEGELLCEHDPFLDRILSQ